MSWGYHLILDCSGCELDAINSEQNILEFTKQLIEDIDMVAFGDPQLHFLLPGTDNEGWSLLQMITTSNITAHFVNKDCTAYIDVFSCKQFDPEVAKKVVSMFFCPKDIKDTFLTRHA